MTFKGHLKNIVRDYKTGKLNVLFEADELDTEALDRIGDHLLSIETKVYREKRSLDANAYAWVLLQKMAEAIGSTKEDCYIYCLQRYSRAFTHVIIAEEAIPKMKSMWRTVVDLGEVEPGMHQLQLYYGSHTFDSKEMAVFIDGIISECREIGGIETATPNEVERMASLWSQSSLKT